VAAGSGKAKRSGSKKPAKKKVAKKKPAGKAPAAKGDAPILADEIPVFCAHDEVVATSSLVPNPRNPNTHPDVQIDLLSKVILNQGWRAPITVSTRSGFVVRGHGRLAAAIRLNAELVPIDRQDYADEASEWADLVADNRIAELAEMDAPALKDLLVEMDTGAFDMDLTGFDATAMEDLMTMTEPGFGEPYGGTSTGQDGQGVTSPWAAVGSRDTVAVKIGLVETSLPGALVKQLGDYMEGKRADVGHRYHETLENVVRAGLENVE